MQMCHVRNCLLYTILLCSLMPSAEAQTEWRGWRGPQQNGHSTDSSLPESWTPEDVKWRVDLPGEGQSCPVFVGDRMFLTAAEDSGRKRLVICLDSTTGKVVWSDVAWTGDPEPTHNMNGWASATCATDGSRVYAFFGHGGGLFCYSVDGKQLWNQNLGAFAGPWGTAASPVLVEDMVIQNCDSDENAYLAAFHKVTGEPIWKTDREDYRGWSTPILLTVNGRQELILNGHTGVRAYDPATGKELWYCEGFSGRGSPTVTPAGGLVHAVCGLRGDTYAVRPGGDGNVTDTHRVWHSPRKAARDLPSPIVLDEQSFVMDMMRATLTSYDIETGRELWRERVADAGRVGRMCASPVAWNNTAYFVSESGTTFGIGAGRGMKPVSENSVNSSPGEIFRTSIIPHKGKLYLRSNRAIYCIE